MNGDIHNATAKKKRENKKKVCLLHNQQTRGLFFPKRISPSVILKFVYPRVDSWDMDVA